MENSQRASGRVADMFMTFPSCDRNLGARSVADSHFSVIACICQVELAQEVE